MIKTDGSLISFLLLDTDMLILPERLFYSELVSELNYTDTQINPIIKYIIFINFSQYKDKSDYICNYTAAIKISAAESCAIKYKDCRNDSPCIFYVIALADLIISLIF